MLAQEVEAEERLDLAPIELDGWDSVEAVEYHAVLEACLLEVAFERLVVAPLDLDMLTCRIGNRLLATLGVYLLSASCSLAATCLLVHERLRAARVTRCPAGTTPWRGAAAGWWSALQGPSWPGHSLPHEWALRMLTESMGRALARGRARVSLLARSTALRSAYFVLTEPAPSESCRSSKADSGNAEDAVHDDRGIYAADQ